MSTDNCYDMSKAIDLVKHDVLFDMMIKRGLSYVYLCVMMDSYIKHSLVMGLDKGQSHLPSFLYLCGWTAKPNMVTVFQHQACCPILHSLQYSCKTFAQIEPSNSFTSWDVKAQLIKSNLAMIKRLKNHRHSFIEFVLWTEERFINRRAIIVLQSQPTVRRPVEYQKTSNKWTQLVLQHDSRQVPASVSLTDCNRENFNIQNLKSLQATSRLAELWKITHKWASQTADHAYNTAGSQ